METQPGVLILLIFWSSKIFLEQPAPAEDENKNEDGGEGGAGGAPKKPGKGGKKGGGKAKAKAKGGKGKHH